jgi:hypothetical protein
MSCRARNRKQYEIYHRRYKSIIKSNKCYYCNDPADTQDHVPALYEVYTRGPDFFEEKGILFWLVPSCAACNSILRTDGWTPDQRAKMVYDYYTTKYSKLIGSPRWTEEELCELGPNLRSLVECQHDAQMWMDRKIGYMRDIFNDLINDG